MYSWFKIVNKQLNSHVERIQNFKLIVYIFLIILFFVIIEEILQNLIPWIYRHRSNYFATRFMIMSISPGYNPRVFSSNTCNALFVFLATSPISSIWIFLISTFTTGICKAQFIHDNNGSEAFLFDNFKFSRNRMVHSNKI